MNLNIIDILADYFYLLLTLLDGRRIISKHQNETRNEVWRLTIEIAKH